jgi:hypothetical protein
LAVLDRQSGLDMPNHLPSRLPRFAAENENPPFPAGSEVELAGLEPATFWVRSRQNDVRPSRFGVLSWGQVPRIALATVVATRRSAPRPIGAKLGVSEGGELAGSVSGDCVENEVYGLAQEAPGGRPPVVARYGISDELGSP